jgi:hypothetical protein
MILVACQGRFSHDRAMRPGRLSNLLQISAGLASMIIVGAAAPVDTSIVPAASQASVEAPKEATKTLTVANASFQDAPVPDQDVNAPPDSSKPDTTISPKLLSPKSLFQGDGYSYASSEQTTLDNRRAAAPGLGLSVPVK